MKDFISFNNEEFNNIFRLPEHPNPFVKNNVRIVNLSCAKERIFFDRAKNPERRKCKFIYYITFNNTFPLVKKCSIKFLGR